LQIITLISIAKHQQTTQTTGGGCVPF